LLERNEILRLNRLRHAVRLHEGNDHVFADASPGHRNHVRNRDCSSRGRTPHSGFDFGPVLGFDIVEAAADGGAAESTDAGSDRGTCAGIADSISDDRPQACAAKSADERAFV
jgi:hypothetical protein